MASTELILVIVLGAVVAVPYCLHVRAAGRPELRFGLGLAIASLLYVIFALAQGAARAALMEAGGVALFGAVVVAGIRWSPYWLAAGWLAHVAWDLALHPIDHSGYAPWWYPVLCIGFDLMVAGFIMAGSPTRPKPRP